MYALLMILYMILYMSLRILFTLRALGYSLIIVISMTSGNQYHYNVRKDMYCEELAPLLLMYDRGKLVGFAWFFVSDISSPVYEKISPPTYSVSYSVVTLLSWVAQGWIKNEKREN
jgi:hypothetical protein